MNVPAISHDHGTRFLSSILFHTSPTDGVSFVAVTTVLFVVTAIAALVPSRRAMDIEPTIALRYEMTSGARRYLVSSLNNSPGLVEGCLPPSPPLNFQSYPTLSSAPPQAKPASKEKGLERIMQSNPVRLD